MNISISISVLANIIGPWNSPHTFYGLDPYGRNLILLLRHGIPIVVASSVDMMLTSAPVSTKTVTRELLMITDV